MKISYQEFLSRTQKGMAPPIYIFSGEDEFYKERAVKKLKKLILKQGVDELSFNLFYGEESTGTDIIKAASTPTLTGDRRLVIVRNADKLGVSAKAVIENYSRSPFPPTCLVLLVRKNDYRFGIEVVFALPSEGESITWITKQAREKGWSISSQAALELKEKVGMDTRTLNNEIEKLVLYCRDKKNITPEDIRVLVGDSKEVITSGIISAINKNEAKKALAILKKLSVDEKKTLINAIAWQMRRQGLGWDRFKKGFRSILQAELDFKSERFSPELVLELLVIRLCS